MWKAQIVTQHTPSRQNKDSVGYRLGIDSPPMDVVLSEGRRVHLAKIFNPLNKSDNAVILLDCTICYLIHLPQIMRTYLFVELPLGSYQSF